MIQIKLALKELTDLEMVDFTKVVGTKLTANSNFTAPPVVGTVLTSDGTTLDTLIQSRAAMEMQVQQLTLQIRTARDKCEGDLGLDAAYVEQTINTVVPPATTIDPWWPRPRRRAPAWMWWARARQWGRCRRWSASGRRRGMWMVGGFALECGQARAGQLHRGEH